MNLDVQQDIAIATVIAVESFPCSMLGQKRIFISKNKKQPGTLPTGILPKGNLSNGNLQLPWNLPMTWIEEQLEELVRGNLSNGMFKVAELINPEEPDQIVKIMIDPYLPETLQQAITAAHNEAPAALVTIVKTQGTAYFQVGARMLIYRDGLTQGTIGCESAEAEVRLAALKVIDAEKPCMLKVSLTAECADIVAIADNVVVAGSSGGGMLEVFIEPVKTFMWALNNGEKANFILE